MTENVKLPHHHIKLNAGFCEDIRMWQEFINNWNGRCFFLSQEWENLFSLGLHTDAASGKGYVGYYRTDWFQGRWEPHQQIGQEGTNIDGQELFAIVVACSIWGPSWSCKMVIFNCDNQTVLDIIHPKRSHSARIMVLVRHIILLTLRHNFYFKAKHIPGSKHAISDPILRFLMTKFRRLATWADKEPQEIPQHLLLL